MLLPAATYGARLAAATGNATPPAVLMWTQIAQVLINMLIADATVTVTGTATGVTAGAAAVPVTGSGTLT